MNREETWNKSNLSLSLKFVVGDSCISELFSSFPDSLLQCRLLHTFTYLLYYRISIVINCWSGAVRGVLAE